MNALETVKKARDILENVTPMKTDCGRICGAACCKSDADGQGGMLLFPEEEKLYDPLPEGFRILRDDSVVENGKLLLCQGFCNRSDRPLSCRLFPLRPTAKGNVKMDRRGFFVCPLTEYGLGGLSGEFVEKCREAARLLCETEETRNYLALLAAHIRQVLEESRFT